MLSNLINESISLHTVSVETIPRKSDWVAKPLEFAISIYRFAASIPTDSLSLNGTSAMLWYCVLGVTSVQRGVTHGWHGEYNYSIGTTTD